MAQLLQLCVNGTALGSVYALVALGFILVSEATGVVNFATGQFVMVGCFFGVTTVMHWHMPLAAGYGMALVFMLLFGCVFYALAYRPLADSATVSIVIGTVGVGIVMQNLALLVWGTLPQRPPSPFGDAQLGLAGESLPMQAVFTIAVTLLLIGLVHALLYHSRFGQQMRATAQDRDAARLMAIPVGLVLLATWLIASVLTGAAGLLLGPLWFADVSMGDPIALKAFAAAIIGGFGNVTGALIGGIAVGLAEILGAAYITSTYKDALVFALMIAFLLFRPQGIFASRISERG